MIRKATIRDIDDICSMGKDFHSFGKLDEKGLRYDKKSLSRYCYFLMGNGHTEIFVALDGGTVVGSIAGIISPWYLDFTQTILTEQWWWVVRSHRGRGVEKELLDELISWGKQSNADRLTMMSLDNDKEKVLRRYYSRMGFRYLETHYIKEI